MRRPFLLIILGSLGVAVTVIAYSCRYFTKSDVIPVYSYKVVNSFPHDSKAFTQGLVFDKGFLYEGTGLYKESSVRRVELETGTVVQIRELPSHFFR